MIQEKSTIIYLWKNYPQTKKLKKGHNHNPLFFQQNKASQTFSFLGENSLDMRRVPSTPNSFLITKHQFTKVSIENTRSPLKKKTCIHRIFSILTAVPGQRKYRLHFSLFNKHNIKSGPKLQCKATVNY